jgi:UDP-glucose 4-epimerase
MKILVTGGLGYIGSHIVVQLLNNNNKVIIIDNLSNSSIDKLDKIKKNVKNIDFDSYLYFYQLDMIQYEDLKCIFIKHDDIDIVIHMAGLKSVNESIHNPIMYYHNNLLSTLNLIDLMEKYNCKNLIFSSSATVYGTGNPPYKEYDQIGIGITNPYGKTKYMQEEILIDLHKSNPDWNIVILRYFNPVGQLNLSLKEEPNGVPNNLFPYIVKVYNNELPILNIYGNNYDTIDGTCIRDFIHVEDLAEGHIKACEYIYINKSIGCKIYNLGSGKGISVKELIDAFETVNNTKINYQYVERRIGDTPISYADCSLSLKDFNWKVKKNINDLVKL